MAGNNCYICLDGGGALISSCSCRGTGGYVHGDCLRDWFETRREWLDLDCPQCKHPFYGQTGVDLATFALSQVQDEHGEESIMYSAALENLAHAFARVRNHQKERELLERALSMKEQAFGPEHVEVAESGRLGRAQLLAKS